MTKMIDRFGVINMTVEKLNFMELTTSNLKELVTLFSAETAQIYSPHNLVIYNVGKVKGTRKILEFKVKANRIRDYNYDCINNRYRDVVSHLNIDSLESFLKIILEYYKTR